MNGETKPSPDKLEQLARFYPMQLDEALRVVAAYRPPNASVVFNLEQPLQRVVLRADATREHILAHFSDLELAQEIVRRIEAEFHVEVGAPLPLAEGVVADRPSNVTALRGGDVGGSAEDLDVIDEPAAAKRKSRDRGEEPEAP